MTTRPLRAMALALLLALAAPADLFPSQDWQPPSTATPCQKVREPRLPAGPLAGKAGTPLLVEVRRDFADADFPFSLSADVLESPPGARLDVDLGRHSLRLLADTPGRYRLRVRGIQQISAG